MKKQLKTKHLTPVSENSGGASITRNGDPIAHTCSLPKVSSLTSEDIAMYADEVMRENDGLLRRLA